VPTIVLSGPIARYLPSPRHGEASFRVAGATVREALEQLFTQLPQLRGYVLDDQGALRHHVAAFVNGVVVRDKHSLAEPVPADGEIYLVQALSGG
jgi:sulfur-carrier protein